MVSVPPNTPKRGKKGKSSPPATPSNGGNGAQKRKSQKEEGLDTFQLSAYAVFNNLVPGVKRYEDTSESTPASQRRKKNKKMNKLKQEEDEKKKAVTPTTSNNSKKPSAGETSINGKAALEKSSEPRRITPISVQQINSNDGGTTMNGTEDGSEGKTKKKKKRNKNKNKAKNNEGNVIVPNPSVAEPPAKLRKIDDKNQPKQQRKVELLPNPLAIINRKNKETVHTVTPVNAEGKKKSGPEKSKLQPKPVVTSSKPIVNVDNVKATKKSGKDGSKSGQSTDSPVVGPPPDIESLLSSKVVEDSVEYGKDLFSWLIHPQSIESFMSNYWETRPFLIKRNLFSNYYDWIMSTAKLDDIVRNNSLKYTKNIDVVFYENGERQTVSEDMNHRVRPAVLWDYYATGNSIRLLNPQTYCSPLRRLNAALQEMFGSFVGANVYLTPPDSQGFAPHWDDIEAFVLQIEGKKHWKVYGPRNPNEVLARYSSKDFGKEQETLGRPLIDVVLEPGDLLYFPRGAIHQANTVEGHHSMHITISCHQQNSWADLLKQHFSKAVDKLAANDVEFRKGLPLDYLSFLGLAPSKKKDKGTIAKRKAFKSTLKQLITKVGNYEPDEGADEMGKKFVWDSMPPYLTRKEKDKTVVEDGEFLNNGKVKHRVEMDPDTRVKLVRKHCARLVFEEGGLRLYFSTENPLVYHEEELQFVEISEEFQPAIERLINSYPEFVRIEDLPMVGNDILKQIQLAADLWERGILMTEKCLEAGEFDEEDLDFDDAAETMYDDDLDELGEDDSDIAEDLLDEDQDGSMEDSEISDDFEDMDDGNESSDDLQGMGSDNDEDDEEEENDEVEYDSDLEEVDAELEIDNDDEDVDNDDEDDEDSD